MDTMNQIETHGIIYLLLINVYKTGFEISLGLK